MNYQKEYATLVGQVDRAICLLEQFPKSDPIVEAAGQVLLRALLTAEEHFLAQAEQR